MLLSKCHEIWEGYWYTVLAESCKISQGCDSYLLPFCHFPQVGPIWSIRLLKFKIKFWRQWNFVNKNLFSHWNKLKQHDLATLLLLNLSSLISQIGPPVENGKMAVSMNHSPMKFYRTLLKSYISIPPKFHDFWIIIICWIFK